MPPRTAHLTLNNGVAPGTWEAVAAVQDAGGGEFIDIECQGGVAVGGPGEPQTASLKVYSSSGALIRTFTFTNAQWSAGVVARYYFTHNGTSTGTPRSGTVELAIHVTRTAGTAADNYDYETDGSPAVLPAGTTPTRVDRGWIRGTTTAVAAVSNVALGGAKNEPAEEGESLYQRLTLAHQPYDSQSITLGMTGGGHTVSASASSSTTVFNATHTAAVTDSFAPAASTVTSTAAPANNAGRSGFTTGQPWTVLTTHTADSITVDPRLTVASRLFLVDDNTFATPPMSEHNASMQMTLDQIGYLAVRVTRARGGGRNGLTVGQTVTPRKSGSAKSASSATANRGGEDGWTDLLVWDSIKPGGVWDWVADITAPAAIDADAHLASPTTTVELLAPANPDVRPIVSAGSLARPQGHSVPGDAITLGLALRNRKTRKYLVPDSPPTMVILRVNASLGRGEFLAADGSWQPAQAGGVPVEAHAWTLAPLPSDPFLYVVQFTAEQTLAWGPFNLKLEGLAVYQGTSYPANGDLEMTGTGNDHGELFDPLHLVL